MKHVVIIGSMKFDKSMEQLGKLLSSNGYDAIYPTRQTFNNEQERIEYNAKYMTYIEKAELVIVYDKYTYIGLHTYAEYMHAESLNKPIIKVSDNFDEVNNEIDDDFTHTKILNMIKDGSYINDND